MSSRKRIKIEKEESKDSKQPIDESKDTKQPSDKNAKRVVRLYLEDWEKKIIQEKNASNEQKLINKYAGLKWKEDLDNDDEKTFVACTDEIHWEKPDDSPAITKYARFQPPIHDEYGYCIVGKSEDYDPTDKKNICLSFVR